MVYGRRGSGPKVEFAGTTPYADYTHMETLLSLQTPRTQAPAEYSFIVATQVMELLFTLLRREWETARTQLDADDVRAATRTLRRSVGAQDVLISSWQLLATLTPNEFGAFRDAFGEASGFQSYGYRHLEFLLGNKRPGMVCPHAEMPSVVADLEKQLAEPSLDDAAKAALTRRGTTWLDIYSGHEHPDLYELGEVLMEIAERFIRWRQLHLTAVWRVMGDKPGSGGSAGASWLAKTVHERPFPELWAVRNEL
ncbi:MAG: tryptophan 2,3-dioxygenase [Hamadaea sp.]|uniref:tryptophan 2,3-dioxygenase n=1 Tax=Hamadaea sp. TaxID=2024425 RepID=UPI001791B66A|nr:tryptophan 2,3-dioxygenase family protein [Hamadaea sp.]NUR71832.1 tryptophan 2,3-dioxygenase [Hamadaea sp.]NUT24125.1 tryptophan 2,3-dioxygenase [Hamadaea sp.]